MDIQWFHTVFDPHGKDMLFGSSCHILQPVRRKSWCGVGMTDSMLTGVSFDQRRIYLGLRKINLWIYFLLKKKKKKKKKKITASPEVVKTAGINFLHVSFTQYFLCGTQSIVSKAGS
jgi:hypothetical protein